MSLLASFLAHLVAYTLIGVLSLGTALSILILVIVPYSALIEGGD